MNEINCLCDTQGQCQNWDKNSGYQVFSVKFSLLPIQDHVLESPSRIFSGTSLVFEHEQGLQLFQKEGPCPLTDSGLGRLVDDAQGRLSVHF